MKPLSTTAIIIISAYTTEFARDERGATEEVKAGLKYQMNILDKCMYGK